ncbi:sigma-70 family RNA polymerase sigma factor [Staphylococcus condimenti]|uniref:Sigma-70 family RNA polymerase sigma factor n=1 Tax=Staphylococcus condimenti TaxID=70255 RepID=A0AB37HCG0_9STAP|nr:sigma-70 family RNA polymerase sigma factor [Staphylococcus condimenti]AMY05241.1 hypothetical protein A4G25_04530 [Staphylococcus condimenti]PNZ58429.1 sigma-70 family RNA polymerase sigma factor [Staphylococcus condimenti]QQS82954.1 sigma-70 family RNA polymerase sigma factor [Staphylococcus condimenti]QRP94611.1 sigma-70 family RNA polymerase sigma factor [Staphylococcus condimenti]VEG64834.1 RNA polymerase sigma factor, sigma-70 family [Staphylococcus condimenti]
MIELINLYRQNKLELESLELQKDICIDEMENWGAVTPTDYKARLGKKHDFFTRIRQTDDLIKEVNAINKRIEEIEYRQKRILNVINKFSGLEHKILKYKYIDGYTLQSVAEKTGYSEQYIRNKHAELKKRIEFV